MDIAFLCSSKTWCKDFAEIFSDGAARSGDNVRIFDIGDTVPSDFEMIAILGVGYKSTYDFLKSTESTVLYIDKGYFRQKDHFRISLNSRYPLDVGRLNLPAKRRNKYGWIKQPWRESGNSVLVALSSENYHETECLSPLEDYRRELDLELSGKTERDIIFRYKRDANASLSEHLDDAHVVITHGSAVCLDAFIRGVPSIVLGPGVTRNVSSTDLSDVENPRLADEEECERFLNDLTYFQWSIDEFKSGKFMKKCPFLNPESN